MLSLAWLLKPRNLGYLFIAAVLLSSISLLLTFLISDAQRLGAKAVLGSVDVARSIGPPSHALLIGGASKYSGSFGCEDFRYLVFGKSGSEVVQVRLESRGGKVRNWKVLEVMEGMRTDFNVACWKKSES